MTRKSKRLTLIVGALAALGVAAGLILFALRDNIVFFYTPSELAKKKPRPWDEIKNWRPGKAR